MKIMKSQLRKIIKEEIKKALPEKIATREFSRIDDKDRTADLKAWRGKSADRFDPVGDITTEVWKIMLKKSKAWLEKNKTKTESKVRFTKRQLQKIIKEEIKRALFEDDVDAWDAKWEAGDIITMDFGDVDENIDVDAIIDDELNAAIGALKFRHPLMMFLVNKCGLKQYERYINATEASAPPGWDYIEDVNIQDGVLQIQLKPERKYDLEELPEEDENQCREAGFDAIPLPAGRDVFPEDLWEHLEEDINAAISAEGQRSSMTEDQDDGPSKEECDDLKGAQGTYKAESSEELQTISKCKKRYGSPERGT